MNENELYRIELRARSVLAEHETDPIHSKYCRPCCTLWPCDPRRAALMLLEWIKAVQEKL